ncbi:MAG: cation-transporter ATPase [Blastococcus sp.]|nr:cation-transporter ATPase [Blastococcus sp.]
MTVLPATAPELIRGSLRASGRLTQETFNASARIARGVLTAPRSTLRAVTAAGVAAGVDRQIWAVGDLAMLEVRGLARGAGRPASATAVQTALAAVDGITWARVDAATGRVAVRYDARRYTLSDIAGALARAEQQAPTETPGCRRAGTGDAPGSPGDERAAPPHVGPGTDGSPDDARVPKVHTVALAANLLAAAAVAAARAARMPTLPPGTAALVALVEHQPWLRSRLERRLGAAGCELVLAVANATVLGLTGTVHPLVVDSARRVQTLRATRATQAAVARLGPGLTGPPRPDRTTPLGTDERPGPLPEGPVERLVRRTATGSLLAAGAALAATADLDVAGRALLVGAPRAAVLAREAYADTLAIALARRQILTLDLGSLRRLDRVTTVVVESAVLHVDRRLVVRARALDGWPMERVWRAAQHLLEMGDAASAGPSDLALVRPESDPVGPGQDATALTRLILTSDGDTVGDVLVGRELDPLSAAALSAAREAGLRLVLTEDPAAAALVGRADEVLHDDGEDGGWLRRHVRRLQGDGEVVAVIGADEDALDAADIGVGIIPATGRVPWAADLLCGPGLLELPRLLAAVPAARSNSERAVRLSLASTFLGGLLVAVGPGPRGDRATLPVTMGAAGAILSAVRAAQRIGGLRDPVAVPDTPWHALAPGEVLGRVPDPGQPAREEPAPGRSSAPRRTARALAGLVSNVRAELADPLTLVLATGAAASAVIGSPTDALLVAGVLAGSAVISGAQRMRAERALRSLLLEQRLPGRIVDLDSADRRHGGSGPLRGIPATRLQPGHVIDLAGGDVVPADARLLLVDDLEVDEATLTGESSPVGKQLTATPGADLPDRACMVYEGTTIVAGSGRAVVVAVGPATEAGRALALAGRAGAPAGMQARLEELTSKALPVTLAGGATVSAMALLRGQTAQAAIAGGVAVAVAAVPEGLPLMATVAQLGAARRLSRRGVLVRASRTVEALGRVSTMCFDKTGTLTEGHLRLVRVADLGGEWAPDAAAARRMLRAAAHASPRRNGTHASTHATDEAVLDAARAILGDQLDEEWEELTEVPFHSERKFSAAVGRTPGKVRVVVKGAPEVLLPRCSHVRDDRGKRPLDSAHRARAADAVNDLAAQGLRVLAVARRNVGGVGDVAEPVPEPEEVADLGDLTLLGFIALADTARPQAAATIATLAKSGVRPVMITGDHPVTARAIAVTLGMPAEDLVTGPELADLDEGARIARVRGASVFARVSPEQKLQIVEALRHDGQVVAMAGDGANDAAAIRLADVGIGMAAKGSTSARSAADLVLTEPDIGLVIDALVEGRAMWRRVRDAVAVLLGGNVGEIAFTLAGTALGGHAPISTRQFLVVNMFTDLLPSMALALAPTPAGTVERSALLTSGPPSLGAPLLRDIGLRGAVTSASALVAWQIGRFTGSRQRAGTMALATLIGTELGQTLLLGGRNPLVLATSLGSAAVLAAVIQLPGVSGFLGSTPLGPVAWSVVLACSAGATFASATLPRLRAPRGPAVPDPQG